MTRPVLIIDNTRPIDATVPDLYDGIAANDDGRGLYVFPYNAAANVLRRLASLSFWIALGLVVGLVI